MGMEEVAHINRKDARVKQAKFNASLKAQLDEEYNINPSRIYSKNKKRKLANYLGAKYGNQSADEIYDRWTGLEA